MYFFLQESVNEERGSLIKLDLEKSGYGWMGGSYHIFQARVMGLPYHEYLRMCRDMYGAILTGKTTTCIIPVFFNKEKAQNLIQILDTRLMVLRGERTTL